VSPVEPAGTLIDTFLPQITDGASGENVVVSVEAPYWEFGFGTLRLRDSICVAKTGYERVNGSRHEMFVC